MKSLSKLIVSLVQIFDFVVCLKVPFGVSNLFDNHHVSLYVNDQVVITLSL